MGIFQTLSEREDFTRLDLSHEFMFTAIYLSFFTVIMLSQFLKLQNLQIFTFFFFEEKKKIIIGLTQNIRNPKRFCRLLILNWMSDLTVDSTASRPSSSSTLLPTATVTDDAAVFEKQHVHAVYNSIAGHFSSTRYKAWPLVRKFVESLPKGSFMADVGCGNGKNLALSDDIASFGCDYCEALVKIASGQHLEVARSDALTTPYRTASMDAAISIAVIHHFATQQRRAEAVQELLRIVKPGGRVLIYVWAREQPKKRCADDNVSGDVLIPWETHKKFDDMETVHPRYYHLFRKGELESLCLQDSRISSQCDVEESYFDKENWCIVLRRCEKL